MKRPEFNDYKPKEAQTLVDVIGWYNSYVKDLERYADYLEDQTQAPDPNSIPLGTLQVGKTLKSQIK